MANNIIDSFLILFTTQVRGNGIQQLNKQTAGVMKNMSGAGNMLKMFFGYDLYTTVRQLIPDLINTSKQIGAMESRFNAVSESAKQGSVELQWLADESKRLGLNFLKTADNYSIFYATVRKTMGQETTRDVFQQWSEAFRVLHIDPERQGRVLYALREMSSKGKIYMQDLALQLGSAVPDAMNLAAKAMGYTGVDAVTRFREAIQRGEIDVKKFIPLFTKGMHQAYVSADALAVAMSKPDAQIELLITRWQLFQKKLYEGGFEKDLVGTLKIVNNLMEGLEEHGLTLYAIIKGIVGLLTFLFVSKGIIGIAGWIKNVSILIKEMGVLAGVLQMLKIYTSYGAGSSIAGFLIPLLKNPYVLGALLVIGFGMLAKFFFSKFFPQANKQLDIMLDDLELEMVTAVNNMSIAWENSAIGKAWATISGAVKNTFIGDETKPGGMTNWDREANSLPVKLANFVTFGQVSRDAENFNRIRSGLGQVPQQITNKLDVTMKFESKGEIPEEQMVALKDKVGGAFLSSLDIINSKSNSNQPKYLQTTPLRLSI